MSLQQPMDPSIPRILEDIPGIMWVTDRELRFNCVYGRGLQDLGLTPEQVVGTTLSEFLGTKEDGFPAIDAHIKALSGEVAACQQDYCGRVLQISVKPHRDRDGGTIGCIGIAEDITKLRQSEEQTEQTRRLQEAIGKIFGVFKGSEPIDEQLDCCLDILLSIPWLSVQSCGSIFIVDAGSQTISLKAQRGLPDSLLTACARVPFGHCLCGRAASTGKVVFADCVDGRHETRYEGISNHGHYCLPMLAEKEVVGVLNLYLHPSHRRDAREEQFLFIVGAVIAGAIKYRQVGEALRESEERFALAVRGTNAGIWDWDLRTNKVYFSSRWKSLIGYADDEIGSDFAEWETRIHPKDRDRALATVRDYLNGSLANFELEHRLLHKDGSYRWILARGAVVRDEAGHARRMVGSHLDITERKRLENALREQHAKLIAAEEIQSFLLPKSAPVVPGFDIAGKCYPAEFAAGDHFDFLFLQSGRFLPVIGDVSGHGVGPAILMAAVHAHLRSLTAVETDLGKLVTRLNSIIARESPEQRFVTLLAAEIDLPKRFLHYVSCGHPPGILMDTAGQVTAALDQGDLPLGIIEEREYHSQGPIQLQPGDVLTLFTDGILEAVSASGAQFGHQGVIDAIRENREKPASEMVEALVRSAGDFVGRETFDDDVTIVVVKVL